MPSMDTDSQFDLDVRITMESASCLFLQIGRSGQLYTVAILDTHFEALLRFILERVTDGPSINFDLFFCYIKWSQGDLLRQSVWSTLKQCPDAVMRLSFLGTSQNKHSIAFNIHLTLTEAVQTHVGPTTSIANEHLPTLAKSGLPLES